MLIKLTALAHPDINGGRPWPVYIEARSIISISRAMHQHIRLDRADLKREVYDDIFFGIQRLNKLLHEKMPAEIDTQEAARWAREIHIVTHDVQECYGVWGRAWRADDMHPRVECTELQLACGTALEHGVMLARYWVTESPDEVYAKINLTDPRAATSGLPT